MNIDTKILNEIRKVNLAKYEKYIMTETFPKNARLVYHVKIYLCIILIQQRIKTVCSS